VVTFHETLFLPLLATSFYFLSCTEILLIVIFFVISSLIVIIKNIWISSGFLIFCLIAFLSIPIILKTNTPKLELEWDEQWKKVLEEYLKKTNLQNNKTNKAKQNLKRAILYYRREGKPINFFVNLLWGGIFIGCLPDPAFQKALITGNPITIWDANPLGAIGVLSLPFIYTYYHVRYDIPIAFLENVLSQIELEE
jgi:hypothetical protein